MNEVDIFKFKPINLGRLLRSLRSQWWLLTDQKLHRLDRPKGRSESLTSGDKLFFSIGRFRGFYAWEKFSGSTYTV